VYEEHGEHPAENVPYFLFSAIQDATNRYYAIAIFDNTILIAIRIIAIARKA
jgi:hypothetical protein